MAQASQNEVVRIPRDPKYINPFESLLRTNQPIQLKGKPRRNSGELAGNDPRFDARELGLEQYAPLFTEDEYPQVETGDEPARRGMTALEQSHKAFGQPNSTSNKPTDQQNTNPKVGSQYSPKNIRLQSRNLDRNTCIQRTMDIIRLIAEYYSITEEDRLYEKSRLSEMNAEDLNDALNGYEYIAEHVLIMTDNTRAQQMVLSSNLDLRQFFGQYGTNSDSLEVSSSAETIAQQMIDQEKNARYKK